MDKKKLEKALEELYACGDFSLNYADEISEYIAQLEEIIVDLELELAQWEKRPPLRT